MIITVAVVHMMQTPIDNIVDMVAVGNHWVATVWPVHMIVAVFNRGTTIRVFFTDFNNVLVAMIVMWMMQMAIV